MLQFSKSMEKSGNWWIIITCSLILWLLLLASGNLALAQSSKEELLDKLTKLSGKEKVDTLNALALNQAYSNRTLAMQYAIEAKQEAIRINYRAGEAKAIKNIAIVHLYKSNNDSAMTFFNQALDIYTSIHDIKGISACTHNMGLILLEQGRADEALSAFSQSQEADLKLNDLEGAIRSNSSIASVYNFKGNFRKAIEVLSNGIRLAKKYKYDELLPSLFQNRASNLLELQRFDEALSDYRISIEISEKEGNLYQHALGMINLGYLLYRQQNYNEAISVLNTGLSMCDELEDIDLKANAFKTMSEIYTARMEYRLSNEYLLRSLKLHEEAGDKKWIASIYNLIGINLLLQKEVDKAEAYFGQSYSIAHEIGAKAQLLEVYGSYSNFYSAKLEFARADSFRTLYAALYSDMFKQDSVLSKAEKSLLEPNAQCNNSRENNYHIIAVIVLILIVAVLSNIFLFHRKKSSTATQDIDHDA